MVANNRGSAHRPSWRVDGLGNDQRESHDREADLTREIRRLRLLLQQAGIDAERSAQEISAMEHQRVEEVETERAKMQAARTDADELHHRLKNTLAVVQAIAHATLRSDVPAEDARTAFDSCLAALAHVHDILFAANWGSVNLQNLSTGNGDGRRQNGRL